MNIVIVGNCQNAGLVSCLTLATGVESIEGVSGERLQSGAGVYRAPLERADTVFVQTGKCATFLTAALPEVAERAIRFPRVSFNAFHPDVCAVRDSAGAVVQTPLGDNNSRLAVAAYRHGLSAAATEALFCSHVFRTLGYLDAWSGARAAVQAQFDESGIDTAGLFAAWTRTGCFMHTSLHPKLHVLADIACAMARKIDLLLRTPRPDRYLRDALQDAPIWPIYPEIAAVHGLEGDYCFKTKTQIFALRDFIEASFEVYARADGVHVVNADLDAMIAQALSADTTPRTPPPARAASSAHPYAGIPAHQHWRRAVADVPAAEIDPVVAPRFTLSTQDRVASIGSCFAQHISQRLRAAGLNYLVTEPASAGAEQAFSARYGNVYSARQLDQLFARALDSDAFDDEAAWLRTDGRFADPFRPAIEAHGFESEAALNASRVQHLAAVRQMMEELDVLVVTLGLTEAWRSKRTGATFPIAPGVIAGAWDPSLHEFVNFGVDDVVVDLNAAFDKVSSVNPRARFILTVSPVPLAATYEPRHVLQSTAYSKAVLRVAAEQVCATRPNALYFPSYEIVASSFSRGGYFEPDLRGVTPAGVDHVMRLFLHHLYGRAPVAIPDYEIFCEEDALA